MTRERAVLPNPEAQRLAAIIESSDDAIIGKNLKGIVESWNTGAEHLYGYSRGEMIGKPMDLLLPADRLDEEATILMNILAGKRFDHFETKRRRKNGETVEVSLTISPIRDGNHVVGASHIARNITDRTKLERLASQLAAIVLSSHDAIVGKSLDGVIETWNPAAQILYGYSSEEIVGRSMSVLLVPGASADEREILARIRNGEQVEHRMANRIRKDGSTVVVSLTVSPIRNPKGEIIGASHIARDITRQRELDLRMQQTQKLESLGLLAGGVAHDFNNLLTGILGNSSLTMERLPKASPLREQLADVMKAAEAAALLTRQLLAYAGKGTYVVEHINLSDLVRETCHLVEASITPNVHLLLELGKELPAVSGDVGQLQQVVMNLVINAVEAIGERKGRVIARTWLQDADDIYLKTLFAATELGAGQYVALEVHDTGSGMDEETQNKIFDPFFTTKFAGRGLGLAAVRGIVRGHGGALKVYSAPGEGSSFKMLLPLAIDAMPVLGHKTGEDDSVMGAGHIMVIDDDEVVGRFARKALEHFGYSVTVARSGTEALDIFSRNPRGFYVILLDLTMPGMNGEEVFRRLQALNPGIRVFLSSGFNETTAMRHFSGKGLAGFIQKPYTVRNLAQQIKAA